MSLVKDARTLFHLVFKSGRGDTHQERLESFYSGQAADYDSFRERLLKGRGELLEKVNGGFNDSWTSNSLDLWVDMGGGTARNLAFHDGLRTRFKDVVVVDLSQSLLDRAQERVSQEGWSNVSLKCADATKVAPLDNGNSKNVADLVTFSYSLTMIPDWFDALEHAYRLLKPGGIVAVVDFYVGRKYPSENHVKHSWFVRTFWRTWFSFDNVYLSPDHLPFLESHFERIDLMENFASVPYFPVAKVPYYSFIGRKPYGASSPPE
jgi:S-adenosylmethionine-diacylgycerolhomoserine-N-methlytransferase